MLGNVWTATVRCLYRKYPTCGPIFLPFPNLPEVRALQPDWPHDSWQAYVACPVCGGIDHFRKADIKWGLTSPSLDRDQRMLNPFQRVQLKCADANCDCPIEVLFPLARYKTTQDLARDLDRGAGHAVCLKKHGLTRPIVVVEIEEIADL
jgi:hypothetical protein